MEVEGDVDAPLATAAALHATAAAARLRLHDVHRLASLGVLELGHPEVDVADVSRLGAQWRPVGRHRIHLREQAAARAVDRAFLPLYFERHREPAGLLEAHNRRAARVAAGANLHLKRPAVSPAQSAAAARLLNRIHDVGLLHRRFAHTVALQLAPVEAGHLELGLGLAAHALLEAAPHGLLDEERLVLLKCRNYRALVHRLLLGGSDAFRLYFI
mmetsp:Transcript_94704/g.203369  ORF Transcript_94704/g.203369 Transcript_94704/m.203369 type:complete len:215 (+) Transcript_94704:565-1209(+)